MKHNFNVWIAPCAALFGLILFYNITMVAQPYATKQQSRFEGIGLPRNSGGPQSESVRAAAIDALRHAARKPWDVAMGPQPQWTVVGPLATAGRVRSVIVHPSNPDVVYIGAAAGGVWKTTNAGTSWTPTMDDANGIAMGALAMDPRNPDVLWAGTGEQVRRTSSAYLGCGLLRTTDAGATWTPAGLPSVGSFSRIIIHPARPSLIMAAAMNTDAGVWRSTNDGSTWQRVFDGQAYDLTTNPSNPDEFFVAIPDSGVYRTVDGGATWQRRMSGIDGSIGRTSVQQAPSQPSTLYALVERNARGSIWKSTNSGESWSSLYEATNGCFFAGTCSESASQGFYNNFVTIHPTNPNICLVGGIDIWRTTDGMNFDNITRGYERGRPMGPVHVDQHAAAFAPSNPDVVYEGNDGGMVRSTDAGQTWSVINNGLAITQFYSFDVDPMVRGRMAGGTQDNGSLATLRNAVDWDSVYGGDGMTTVIDHTDPATIFFGLPYGSLFRINSETGAIRFVVVGIELNERAIWAAPLVMAPSDHNVLFTGRRRVYRTDNGADTWSASSPLFGGAVSALAVAPSNPNVIAAGSDRGELMLSTDGGTSWTFAPEDALPTRWISSLSFDPNDATTLWVGFQGYGGAPVWRTVDGGTSWHAKSDGFPNVPVNCLRHHPTQGGVLYVATDVGVFATADNGATWFPFGVGLPRTPVVDVKLNPTLGYIRAATMGRSIWEAAISVDAPTEPVVTTPAGGENLVGLRTTTVSWNGIEPPVDVEYSVDGGSEWLPIASGVNAYATQWRVPHFPTATAFVRVRKAAQPNVMAVSRLFSIAAVRQGAQLQSRNTWWRPNGLAFDGKSTLWTTSFTRRQLFKLDANSLDLVGSVRLHADAGDSMFTDVAFDSAQGRMFIHRLNDNDGTSATIIVADTLGNVQRTFASPATAYGLGLALRDGNLVVGERDAPWRLFIVDTASGAVIRTVVNPSRGSFGPRCLTPGRGTAVLQAFTAFTMATDRIHDAIIDEIFEENGTAQRGRRLSLFTRDNPVNVRGVAADATVETVWVSDFNGQIHRFATWDVEVPPISRVASTDVEADVRLAPLPASESTLLRITPLRAGVMTIRIIDALGKTIGEPRRVIGAPYEETAVRLATGMLPSGLYSVVVDVGGTQVAARPLPVIR